MKSCPGEFAIRYFGSNDFNWMSKFRCFPYRGKEHDPHFVAMSYLKKNLNKKNLTKNQELFRLALMEVEKVFDRRRASDYKIELIERPWKRIEKNKISKSLKIDLEEEMICKCNRFDPNPCGPDSECHNRSMFIECGV